MKTATFLTRIECAELFGVHTMRKFFPLVLLLIVALSGCLARHALRHQGHSHGNQIHGSAYFVERVLMPPDAVLDVQLIDDRIANTPNAIIAEQTYGSLQGPPYDFRLTYDPSRMKSGMTYSLHAELRSGNGHLEFVTDPRIPVTPGDKDVVSVRMVRVPASP
jgi:uncharacterized lipoprotein YbaY